MFVDETGASTKMTRLYGRCPRGERLVAPVPWGHWKTTTFIGALRQDGLVAPCAFDGPINGEKFRAWVEQFLAPELKPGDIVILDNLPSHKVEGVRTAIENAGARLLYLPSYSPDLNPIEQWFAKLKALLRKAEARTFDALIQAIASALETFTPDESQTISQTQDIAANNENALRLETADNCSISRRRSPLRARATPRPGPARSPNNRSASTPDARRRS